MKSALVFATRLKGFKFLAVLLENTYRDVTGSAPVPDCHPVRTCHPASRHPAPVYFLAPARYHCAWVFSFSSRLIVLVEVTRVEEVGSPEVGSWGKVSLSEKVVLVLLAVEAGAVKRPFWVLAINVGSRSCHHGVCHQGVCLCGFMLCMQIRSGSAPYLAGMSGQSVGRVAVRCRRRVRLTTGGVAEVGRSQAYVTVS